MVNKEYSKNDTNEIFKNLINNIFSKYSRICNRHKFLNSFWLIEKISDQLKSKLANSKITKINNIIKLFNFTILILEKEIKSKLIKEEWLNLIQNLILEMNSFKKLYSENKSLDFSDYLKSLFNNCDKLLKFKEKYCQNSFENLRWIYNKWIIRSIEDIDCINDSVYHFISTRLMWGWSWEYIMKKFYAFSKKENFWKIDFIEMILCLRTDHGRKEYSVFIPIDLEKINNKNIWIKNFNLYNKKTQIIDSENIENFIEKKTIKNFENIKSDKNYIWYKTSQLDEYSAIYEGIKRIIPSKLGIVTALESHIKISEDCKIITLSEQTNGQWFNSYKIEKIEDYSIFTRDFIIVPELKYIEIIKQKSTKILKNLFTFIYNNENSKISETKYMTTYLLLENSTSFIKSLNFNSDAHIILIKIAMIDVLIQFYINNAFLVKKDFLDKMKHSPKNDLNYLKIYFEEKDNFINIKNSDNTPPNYFFRTWTNRNEGPNTYETKIIYESLKYFKDIASQTRHKIMHEGKKTDFFDHLIIETLDSILTLSILRIINKKIEKDSDINYQEELMKNFFKEKIFEILKKVV